MNFAVCIMNTRVTCPLPLCSRCTLDFTAY